jgi:hypothetical protein
MLVRFAIEPDSIAGEQRWSARELRGYHDALLKAWKRIGLFVFDGDHLSTSALRTAIEAVHDGSVMHGRWNDFVLRAPSVAGGERWPGNLEEPVLERLAEIARVCFTTDVKVDLYEAAGLALNLELLTLAGAGGCNSFALGERNAAAHIYQGERAEQVWAARFHPLAAALSDRLKRVTVVDPYVITRCLVDRRAELENFLTRLSYSTGRPKHVTVYSLWPYENDQRLGRLEIIEGLRPLHGRVGFERIASLTLRLASGNRIARDRFVMFGDSYVWDLGHGLEPFELDLVERTCSASLKTWEAAQSYGRVIDGMAGVELLQIW